MNLNYKTMTLDYHFGKTGGGDVSGFNDPVAANFAYTDNLTDSLIRESLQNIIDAKLPGETPVRAEFDMENIPAKTLPNPEGLEQIFRSCAEYAEKRKVIPAAKHYRAQADILKSNASIPMLRIADYNTCGLTGDTDDGRWFMFMRGVGFNAGEAGAGGAFGLGKGAFFANSLFRTIFVSSVTDDGVKFAGKLRLLSFEKDKELMQGNGTFGLPGQFPLQNKKDIPKIFQRTNKGTDIWVVNFLGNGDWQDTICRAVLGWFWPSIHWGILTVRVGNKEFNASNLRERMAEFFSLDEKRSSKPHNPLHFFDSYIYPEKKLTENPDVLGEVSFYGKTSEDLPFPNKTALVRNTGMIVDFKGRSSHLTRYAAIFECRSEKGSEVLRKMENPAHTEWDWRNWKDEHGHYIEDGKAACNELEIFIAGGLGGLLYAPISQTTTIPGLAEHVGVPTKEGNLSDTGDAKNQIKEPIEEETGIEIGSDEEDEAGSSHTIRPIRITRYIKVRIDNPPTPSTPPGPLRPYDIPNHIPEPNDKGKSVKSKELENASVRYILENQTKDGQVYRIIIHTGNKEDESVVRIRLFARTDDGSDELLPISKVSGERKTKVVKQGRDYCDFHLDTTGSAYLSVQLEEPQIVALEPNLRILP
jgi:hypothetical protein